MIHCSDLVSAEIQGGGGGKKIGKMNYWVDIVFIYYCAYTAFVIYISNSDNGETRFMGRACAQSAPFPLIVLLVSFCSGQVILPCLCTV